MESIKRVNILGCPFDAISFSETVECIEKAVIKNTILQVVPGSIDFVIKAQKDPHFAGLLSRSDLVIADGVPIVWAAKILRDPIKGRISGTDIVWECARISAKLGFPVALVGGKYEVTLRAVELMKSSYPNACLIPLETPFALSSNDNQEIVKKITTAGAKIVLAAFGAPKQERWVQENLKASGANVGIGVGSAFDIISGDKPRAPRLLRDNGLEWFWRMMLEPRRLWKRYFIEDAPFIYLMVLEVVKRMLR